ncbi:MAG: Ppx/GppA family phosphatase, partial [Actinomycetota bacterium]
MSTIVPRWEWRTFGRRLSKARAGFDRLQPERVDESDEVYLLPTSGGSVKIRNDLVDIKVLQEVDASGLELWKPVMKQGFPLAAADVAQVFEALQLPVEPALPADSLDALLAALHERRTDMRAVGVHKRRAHFAFEGCLAEVSDVEVLEHTTCSIAIESEDPASVVRAIEAAGLAGYVNTSYPVGLAALIDDAPERYAVVDAGTNSIKFHVGELGGDGSWRTVVDRAEITRLGEGLAERGTIGADALERTATAISGMVDEAEREGARAIVAVGTAGLRMASNREEVIAAIHDRAGVTIEIIPGSEEARLAYQAARTSLGRPAGSSVVFDTGGGSTQFTFGHGSDVDERFSVDVGAARFTERFGLAGAVAPDMLRDAIAAISVDLARLDGRPTPETIIAMGGAVTNLASVAHGLATYDPNVVNGSVLESSEIDRQIERYRSMDAEAR